MTRNSLVSWSTEERREVLSQVVRILIARTLYPLGKGEPLRISEQGNGMIRSFGKII